MDPPSHMFGAKLPGLVKGTKENTTELVLENHSQNPRHVIFTQTAATTECQSDRQLEGLGEQAPSGDRPNGLSD